MPCRCRFLTLCRCVFGQSLAQLSIYQRNHNHAGHGDKHRGGNGNAGNEIAEVAEAGIVDDGQLVVVDPGGDGAARSKQDQGRDHGLDLKVGNQRAAEGAEEHCHNAGH